MVPKVSRHACVATACMVTSYAASTCSLARAQGPQKTSQSSVMLQIGPDTATQPDIGSISATQGPINLTFVYPESGVDPELPWIMLMSGANCYSQDYSHLEHQLSAMGYLVAVADQLHPNPSSISLLAPEREPQCSNTSYSVPTASIFNDIHSILAASLEGHAFAGVTLSPTTKTAFADVQLESVVLVCHSLGGTVAVEMITGVCEDLEQPYCSNYTQIVDSNGNDILEGVIMFEAGRQTADNELNIADDYFLTYLTSMDYANETLALFEHTDGQCVQYIELTSGNHYAITDWNPATAPYQRAPCGRVASGSDYIITQSEQEARVTFLSKLVDVDIRAKTLNDTSAVQALRALQVSNTSFVELADIA